MSLLSDQVADFLSEKSRRKSQSTAEQYRFILERIFLPWAIAEGLYEVSDCTDKVMDRFQDSLLSRSLSVASVRTYIRGVRIFLNWSGVAAGRFEPVAEPQRLRDPLTKEEIKAVERKATSERDALIIRVLADTGIRISELLGLRLRDLREDGHTHHCFIRVIGKGNREREVGIPADTFRRLRKLAMGDSRIYEKELEPAIFRGRGGKRLTRNGAGQIIRRLAKEARIGRKVHAHLFRHGFITQQLRAGKVDLVTLQKHVGHKTLAMISQTYSHVTADDSYDRLMEGLKG